MDEYVLTTEVNQYIRDNWTKTDIWFPNENFVPPTNAPNQAVFLRVEYIFGPKQEIEMGRLGAYQQSGFLVIEINIRTKQGLDRGWNYASILSPLFRRLKVSQAEFGEPTTRYGGNIPRSGDVKGWEVLEMMIPFIQICE